MTRKEARETEAMLTRLELLLDQHTSPGTPVNGQARIDAESLRRISMTLHRWHELECGDGHGCIERDETDGKPYYRNSDGHRHSRPLPDREAGARKRLAAIMARYPTLQAYVQTDPRGAALYILRPGDVPEGESVDSYYSRGVAVYK